MTDPLVGQTLGQYELHAPLGRGGMATVYRGFQPSLGRAVAIKVLPIGHVPDPTFPARFRREARLAASLMHPNVVPVYDFGEWQDYLYIVMALVSGGTLKDRMQVPLPVESVIQLVGQVSDGLGFAHAQGIFHRDIKPANVLMSAADWAMLGDFGIARALGETTRLTGARSIIGTPAYMAPEQWMGGDVDGRTDLYALGILLYELLAGSPPFTATTNEGLMRQHLEMPIPALASRQTGLPAEFDEVLRTVLAKEPERRFRHAGEFKAALHAAAVERQTTSSHPRTDSGWSDGSSIPPLHAEPTVRVAASQPSTAALERVPHPGGLRGVALLLVLLSMIVLAGTVGYVVAGGRLDGTPRTPPPEMASQPPTTVPATPVPPTAAPPPVATGLPVPATAMPPTPVPPTPAPPTLVPPTTVPPTAVPPTAVPPTVSAPTSAPVAKPAVVQAPARAANLPISAPAVDQRAAQIERHIGDYFAALNAGDFARAQAVCCTQAWRARYPLEEWRRNFAGVTDLRLVSPVRYVDVQANRIIADVDYSFVNSSGTRRTFTLRWTFVPVGNDWLAEEAVASPQR